MTRSYLIDLFIWLSVVGLLGGCAGPQEVKLADPYLLLTEGRYAEARAVVVKANAKDPMSRAIVAVSLAAEDPTPQNGTLAVGALTDGVQEGELLPAVNRTLNLAFYVPQPVAAKSSLLIVEIALGALGQGPLGATESARPTVNDATRQVAIAALERVKDALQQPQATFDSFHLHAIWNGCRALMENDFQATAAEAWVLFSSLGTIAAVVQAALPNSDLARELLKSAVVVLETNPNIAVAARCDLASPFDKLKMALAYKRNLAGRLEAATSTAVGCTRGTYAPETR